MAEKFSLARRCLEAVTENIALRCRDVKLNYDLICPDVTFSQLSKCYLS